MDDGAEIDDGTYPLVVERDARPKVGHMTESQVSVRADRKGPFPYVSVIAGVVWVRWAASF